MMNAEKKMTDYCGRMDSRVARTREHEMKDKFREIYEAERKQHETRLEKLGADYHPTEKLRGTRPGCIRKKHQR